MDERETAKVKGPKNTYRINESVGMVCWAVAYLKNIYGEASRKTQERFRDVLVERVKYEKAPYQGPNRPGGYVFDRDSLWNDFFLAFPEYKKVIEYRRIESIDELEYRMLTWRAEQFSAQMTSLDEMMENGIEPGYEQHTYNGQKRKVHNKYDG